MARLEEAALPANEGVGEVGNGISPWDKYNHCNGEGPDRITAGNNFRLAALAFSESHPHLEENPDLSRHLAAFCHWPVERSQGEKINVLGPSHSNKESYRIRLKFVHLVAPFRRDSL